MQIMTQDRKRLIRAEQASMFFISETPEETTLYAALLSDSGDIVLGTYEKPEHAELALKFIAESLANPQDRDKITMIPARDELAFANGLLPNGQLPNELKDMLSKLFERNGPRIKSDGSECTCSVCAGKKKKTISKEI